MSDLPEPLRRAIAELDAADRKNAQEIKQLREEHGGAIAALQEQYAAMQDSQKAIISRLGEVPTRDDIRLAVAEGITEPLQKAYSSVPVHIANALLTKRGNEAQQESERANETATWGNFWLMAAAFIALLIGVADLILNLGGLH